MNIEKYLKENWFSVIKYGIGCFMMYTGVKMILIALEIFMAFTPSDLIQALPDETRFMGYCVMIVTAAYLGNMIFNWGMRMFDKPDKDDS